VLSGDLSFVGGGTIITSAGGGGAVLATASYGLSAAMVVSFLDAFVCWWAFVFVCCFGWLRFSEDWGS